MTQDLAAQLLQACREKSWSLVTAESCTGGLLAGALTEVPGSSDVFDRGYVTYSYAAKSADLGVDPELLARHGAVSSAVAAAMVDGAVTATGANLVLAVTGVAGPGASANKPEGMVWFGVGGTGLDTQTHLQEFGPLGRAEVRLSSVRYALRLGLSYA